MAPPPSAPPDGPVCASAHTRVVVAAAAMALGVRRMASAAAAVDDGCQSASQPVCCPYAFVSHVFRRHHPRLSPRTPCVQCAAECATVPFVIIIFFFLDAGLFIIIVINFFYLLLFGLLSVCRKKKKESNSSPCAAPGHRVRTVNACDFRKQTARKINKNRRV